MFPTALKYTATKGMKQSIFLFSLLALALIASAGPSNPKDPSSNPYTKVESALLAPLLPPADPMVKVGFSNAIDSGPAFKITNYSVRQTSPELGAGTPGGQLEDVDGDGDLDMVFAKNREIIAYENKGTAGAPLYSGEPVDLVTVGFFESGGTNLDLRRLLGCQRRVC